MCDLYVFIKETHPVAQEPCGSHEGTHHTDHGFCSNQLATNLALGQLKGPMLCFTKFFTLSLVELC